MENLVLDPVCGTEFNPDTIAYKYRYLGQTYYFCSFDCTVIFDEKPEKYKVDIEVGFPFEEGG